MEDDPAYRRRGRHRIDGHFNHRRGVSASKWGKVLHCLGIPDPRDIDVQSSAPGHFPLLLHHPGDLC